jgi:hypothetical protein
MRSASLSTPGGGASVFSKAQEFIASFLEEQV